MVIAALLAGVLTARGRFIVYGIYPVVLNIGVLAAVLPQTDPVDAAYAASWATIVSGIAQAGLCWWGVRRAGARIRLVLPQLTPEVRRLIRLTIPGAVASSAVQVNIFISTMLASHVAGLRVWMSVADRFYQLPLSLVGTAIGVALLPQLSRAFAKEDGPEGQAVMDQALVFGLALCLPACSLSIGPAPPAAPRRQLPPSRSTACPTACAACSARGASYPCGSGKLLCCPTCTSSATVATR
jgi:putative peptidoglycan lipid II flippase